MSKILIELSEDRTIAGTLRLIDSQGFTVAGPFETCGRADRQTGSTNGNSTCDRLRPYGDTPIGTFELIDIIETGAGSGLDAFNYGMHGVIRLRPTDGEAMLAARAGRTGFMIHGGEAGRAGVLRPTSGSVRLSDKDMRAMLEAVAMLAINDSVPSTVTVVACAPRAGAATVGADEGYSEPDPPPGMGDDWHLATLRQLRDAHAYDRVNAGAGEGSGLWDGAQHEREAREPEKHDRDSHSREAHDRGADTRDSHDREMHDRETEREKPDRGSHDRESRDRPR